MSALRKYPEGIRKRAVRKVFERREQQGQPRGGVAEVARQL